MRQNRSRSFRPAAWLAWVAAGCALAFSISREPSVGHVAGHVILADSGKPLARVRIVLTTHIDDTTDDDYADEASEAPPVRRWRAITDSAGAFSLGNIPVGRYDVAAYARDHQSSDDSVWVLQDQSSRLNLKLERTENALSVTQRRTEFGPSESPSIAIHGYTNASGPRDSFHLRIFRTTMANVLDDDRAASKLSEFDTEVDEALPAALLHPIGGIAPVLISDRAVPIVKPDIEGFFVNRFSFGKLPGGFYLAEISHGADRAAVRFTVTNTALVVKNDRDQLLAFAVDSVTGAPRPGANITLRRGAKIVAGGTTGADGTARFSLKGITGGTALASNEKLTTLCTFQGNEAMAGDNQNDDETTQNFAACAYTDRPIYRPGDRVCFKGVVRKTLDPGSRYQVPANLPLSVEIRDPGDGRLYHRQLNTNAYGSFTGSFDLSREAPAGSYTIDTAIDGEEHTSDFTVASYRKPEFTATVTPNRKHYAHGDEVRFFVNAQYYFGVPLNGAEVAYSIYKQPDWRSQDIDDGDSDTDAEDTDSESGAGGGEAVSDGKIKLDSNGNATIRFVADDDDSDSSSDDSDDSQNSDDAGNGDSASDNDAPQDEVFTVTATVTDNAGREVDADGSVQVTAGDFRLRTGASGYFLQPAVASDIEVEARDFNEKPVPGKSFTLTTTYRNWDKTTNTWKDTGFRRYSSTTDQYGRAVVSVIPRREGELEIEATAQDDAGHTITASRSLWVVGEEGGDYDAQYGDISLVSDKKSYRAGENARLLINTSHRGGTALVTVEGSRLYRAWVVPLSHRSTTFNVPIDAAFGPNIVFSACAVNGRKFNSSDLPLKIVVPEREIDVAVHADTTRYLPGATVLYRVATTDNAGKPVACEFSFGVVDESIYALREDDPHRLRDAFYPHNDNAVSTTYSVETIYLGDVNKAETKIETRKKFLDTAYWQPQLQTDSNGNASVQVALPDNLTTWRATAIAQSMSSSFGRGITKIVATKPFFVRLETPRFITSGDSTQILAIAHNETDASQSATVKLVSDGLALNTAETQTATIAPHGSATFAWPVVSDDNAQDYASTARLELIGWAQDAASGKRLTDGIEVRLPVHAHGRARIRNAIGSLQNDAPVRCVLPISTGAVPAASSVTVRLTPSLSASLSAALDYLTGFPYGCTEQTVSRIVPDLLVNNIVKSRGIRDPRARQTTADLPRIMGDGMLRLARLQHDSGAWGWWQFDDDDPWMTAYVMCGLSQAKSAGYPIKGVMLARGRTAALKILDSKTPPAGLRPADRLNWETDRIFLLYAVAIADPSADELKHIAKLRAAISISGLNAQELAYLALLDAKQGRAGAAWHALSRKLGSGAGDTMYWHCGLGANACDWDDLTATAAGLQAMMAAAPNDNRVPAILSWLMTRRQDGDWGNTRDTAWVAEAFCSYLALHAPRVRESGALVIKLNKKILAHFDLGPAAPAGEFVVSVPWGSLRAATNVLTLQRSGGGEPVFYTVQLRQTVAVAAPLQAETTKAARDIQLVREYRVIGKGGSEDWISLPATEAFKAADRVRVRLTVTSPRQLDHVLLEDPIPSGCEITERGTADVEDRQELDPAIWWDETDVRDDKIALFIRTLKPGKHVIEYNLRAQTPGACVALPASLQSMYAPELRTESSENKLTVTPR